MKSGSARGRRALVIAGFSLAALVFGGCDWPMFGYSPSLTQSSPDTAISAANVGTMTQLFKTPTVNPGFNSGSAAVSNGVVYVVNDNQTLYAYDANGSTNCTGTPNTCNPLWTAKLATGTNEIGTTVSGGAVYVSENGETEVFDAAGNANCSGSPKVCTPIRTLEAGNGYSSTNVANGVAYVADGGSLDAFDANGVTYCGGTPKICDPLWQSAAENFQSTPAVANGLVYATSGNHLFAFSSDGSTNCAGAPTTCNPLWEGTLGTSTSGTPTAPVASNGVVYAESGAGVLYAFAANPVSYCAGTAYLCSPLWSASLPDPPQGSSPAVANGIVYAAAGGLEAFDAAGNTDCAGTPKVCTPMWSYHVGTYGSSPVLANGVVYIGSATNANGLQFGVDAFDASGVNGCSGTPKVCSALWTGTTGTPVSATPAVANGKVYAGDGFTLPFYSFNFYAWTLPAPTTAVVVPSNGSTVSGRIWLGASASPGVTQVQFTLTGGTLSHTVIATATSTSFGWLASWNSAAVPNGTYTLQSVASYGGEISGTSPASTVTVSN